MEKIPTYEEIKTYRERLKKREISFEGGAYYAAMHSPFTERIFSFEIPEDAKPFVWKFCKKFASFSHCPVKPADYKRMQAFCGDGALVDVLLLAMDGYYCTDDYGIDFDVVGYYYAVALLSQSEYRRDACLSLLDKLVDYETANLAQKGELLLRNMNALVGEFPDLAPLKSKLENA